MISETVLNKTYFPIETNVLKGGCVFGSEFFGHKHKFFGHKHTPRVVATYPEAGGTELIAVDKVTRAEWQNRPPLHLTLCCHFLHQRERSLGSWLKEHPGWWMELVLHLLA